MPVVIFLIIISCIVLGVICSDIFQGRFQYCLEAALKIYYTMYVGGVSI